MKRTESIEIVDSISMNQGCLKTKQSETKTRPRPHVPRPRPQKVVLRATSLKTFIKNTRAP